MIVFMIMLPMIGGSRRYYVPILKGAHGKVFSRRNIRIGAHGKVFPRLNDISSWYYESNVGHY